MRELVSRIWQVGPGEHGVIYLAFEHHFAGFLAAPLKFSDNGHKFIEQGTVIQLDTTKRPDTVDLSRQRNHCKAETKMAARKMNYSQYVNTCKSCRIFGRSRGHRLAVTITRFIYARFSELFMNKDKYYYRKMNIFRGQIFRTINECIVSKLKTHAFYFQCTLFTKTRIIRK